MSKLSLPNYTQVPNSIIDEWMNKLSHAEFKFIMLIVRETCGFHRRKAKISFRDFHEKCGIGLKTAKRAAKKFEDLQWIKIDHGDQSTQNSYEIILHTGSESGEENVVSNKGGGVTMTLGSPRHQGGVTMTPVSGEPKETLKKEEEEEEISRGGTFPKKSTPAKLTKKSTAEEKILVLEQPVSSLPCSSRKLTSEEASYVENLGKQKVLDFLPAMNKSDLVQQYGVDLVDLVLISFLKKNLKKGILSRRLRSPVGVLYTECKLLNSQKEVSK